MKTHKLNPSRKSIYFILMLGTVSLLCDAAHQGARSIIGPYLATLGAGAIAVGFISGVGEFLGYSLRLISGYWVDKTEKYWSFVIFGYVINMVAIPLMALVHSWQWVALLVVIERIGKAIRTPARDTMISFASFNIGKGAGFGLHEAFDNIGAMVGPLLVALILWLHGSYRQSLLLLLIPGVLAVLVLLLTYRSYPQPREMENGANDLADLNHLDNQVKPLFWRYFAGAVLLAMGFADFPLIAYHFQTAKIFPADLIPISYAVAMAMSAVSALGLGRLYDKKGYIVLLIAVPISALFVPLVFLGGNKLAFIGMILWGIAIGVQTSLMKAIIANMVKVTKRGRAYGIFNAGFGIALFAGSIFMGYLYTVSLPFLVGFALIMQLSSIAVFIFAIRPQNTR